MTEVSCYAKFSFLYCLKQSNLLTFRLLAGTEPSSDLLGLLTLWDIALKWCRQLDYTAQPKNKKHQQLSMIIINKHNFYIKTLTKSTTTCEYVQVS